MKCSYDIIGDAVRAFWRKTYPQDVIAFFRQKYNFETDWEFCAELISNSGSDDYDSVIFNDDFCEGQTEVKDIMIVPLEEIIEFYHDNWRC